MRSRHIERMQKRTPQLVGLNGRALVSKGSQQIPVIQWLPDGTGEGHFFDRGPKVFAQADQFLAKGGRYACVLDGGNARLVAGYPVKDGAKGEMIVVAEETVPNGPGVPRAVDRLVAASIADMPRVTSTVQ